MVAGGEDEVVAEGAGEEEVQGVGGDADEGLGAALAVVVGVGEEFAFGAPAFAEVGAAEAEEGDGPRGRVPSMPRPSPDSKCVLKA